ncbi:MAG TPA: hypothetical protein VFA25_11750 [Actinomycetota bacterium]|nr:hypothetical protein [Actinomycetota bacterium]
MEAATWTAIGLLFGSQIAILVYLGGRIDALSARIYALGGRLDARIDEQSGRIDTLTTQFAEHLRRHAV